ATTASHRGRCDGGLDVGIPATTRDAAKPSPGERRRPTWESLLDVAALAGIDEDTFWNLTSREIERKLWAYYEHKVEIVKQGITIAWWTDSLRRQKRLQSLATFINPAKKVVGEDKQRLQEDHDRMVREMGG